MAFDFLIFNSLQQKKTQFFSTINEQLSARASLVRTSYLSLPENDFVELAASFINLWAGGEMVQRDCSIQIERDDLPNCLHD